MEKHGEGPFQLPVEMHLVASETLQQEEHHAGLSHRRCDLTCDNSWCRHAKIAEYGRQQRRLSFN
jgi:hypothetical protein